MADDSLKKLLVKLGISTGDWKTAVQDIRKQLQAVNDEEKARFVEKQKLSQQELSNTKQLIADQQKLAAEAKAMMALDQAKTAWQKQQQEAVKTRIVQVQLETAENKKQVVEQQALLQLEKQRLSLEQQRARLQGRPGAVQGSDLLSRLGRPTNLSGLASSGLGALLGMDMQGAVGTGGIFGALGGLLGGAAGGPLGAIFGGALGGSIGGGVSTLIEKIKELGKAVYEASGQASQLREQFEKLSARAGADPTEFLNKLRMATRGLADDTQLYRVANNFMQSGVKASSDQIARLAELTVALSRATGKDATTAMNSLVRASLTGRTMMLAMTTGIDRQSLSLKGMSSTMDATTRKTMEFNQVLQAMEKRFAEVGTPVATLPELMKQISNVQKNLIDDFTQAVVRSKGFQDAISAISKGLFDLQGKLDIGKKAAAVGEAIGNAFELVVPLAKALWAAVNALWTQFKIFEQAVVGVINLALKPFGTSIENIVFGGPFQDFKTEIAKIIYTLDTFTLRLQLNTLTVQEWADKTKAVLHGNFDELSKITDEYQQKQADLMLEFSKNVIATEKWRTGTGKGVTPAGPHQPDADTLALKKQLQKLDLQLEEQYNKQKLEMRLEEIEKEKEALKNLYDDGILSLQEYVAQEQQWLEKSHQAKLAQIEADRAAKVKELNLQGSETGEDPRVTSRRVALTNAQAQSQVDKENLANQKEQAAFTRQLLLDQVAARREYVTAVNKIEQEGVQERIKILDGEFKEGKLSADDYLNQKRALIQQELQLKMDALNQQFLAEKNNEADQAKTRVQMVEAQIVAEKQLTELAQNEGKIRTEALTNSYNAAMQYLKAQYELVQSFESGGGAGVKPPGGLIGESGETVLKAEQELNDQQLARLLTEMQRLDDEGKQFSDEWINIQKQISATVAEQQKLNVELAKAKDYATPLANLFDKFASLAGQGGTHSIFGKGFLGGLQSAAKMLRDMAAYQTGVGAQGSGNVFTDALKSFGDLFSKQPKKAGPSPAKTAQEIFQRQLEKTATTTDTFGVTLSNTAAKVNSTFTSFSTTVDNGVNQLQLLAQGAQAAAQKLMNLGTGGAAPAASQLPGTSGITGGAVTPPEFGPVMGQLPGTSSLPSGFDDLDKLSSSASKAADSLDKTSSQGTSFASKISDFEKGISGAITAIGGFIGSITGAKSTSGGILSGGMGGTQMGQEMGKGIADLFGSTSKSIPIVGSIIGGVGGAILGGITGAKQAAMEKEARLIKQKLDQVNDNLKNGFIDMNQAIQQLQALAAESQANLGGSKKGQAQNQQIQDQIAQQIQQIKDEQRKVIQDLIRQLDILKAPLGEQPIIQQLDQIIQKYEQFVSAAGGNVQQMAMANQFLMDSLAQYKTTLGDDIRKAQETAINDAMHLTDLIDQQNQLLIDRNNIINQANQSIYNVMSQGVITRQTGAFTQKGAEIEQIEQQRDQQLKNIDKQILANQEEIDLTRFKLATEQKIFSLATTRIGLEQQLLQTQEQDAQEQLAQVQSQIDAYNHIVAYLANPTYGLGLNAIVPNQLYNILYMLGLTSELWKNAPQNFYPPGYNGPGAQQPTFGGGTMGGGGFHGFGGGGGRGRPGPGIGFNYGVTGTVQETGLATVHKGEKILPPGRGRASEPLIKPEVTPAGVAASVSTAIMNLQMKHATTMHSLSVARIGMEMDLVGKQRAQTMLEFQRLDQLKELISRMQRTGDFLGGGTLEAMMQRIYEIRGRYGSGGFTRESL